MLSRSCTSIFKNFIEKKLIQIVLIDLRLFISQMFQIKHHSLYIFSPLQGHIHLPKANILHRHNYQMMRQ